MLATNTPMHYRAGTVGRLLPGIEHRIEPVPGLDGGGHLSVKEPNVMLGCVRLEAPGRLEPPEGGWHDTGVIVELGDEGFVTVIGRAKRFAKIGGEMISLAVVENLAAELRPDDQHGVIAVSDARKRERLVLATTREGADAEAFRHHVRKTGDSDLMVPKEIVNLRELPRTAIGKPDYVKLTKWIAAGKP